MSTERDNLPVILSNLAHYDAMIKGYIKNRQDEMSPLKHTHVKSEVGLSNVDNTADINKVVASASKWTNPMTLTVTGAMNGSISFDGSTESTLRLSEGDISFKNSPTPISRTTDWNLICTPGCYQVSCSSWGDATTCHSPNQYDSNIISEGLLIVFRTELFDLWMMNSSDGSSTSGSFRKTIQIYFPRSKRYLNDGVTTIMTRMLDYQSEWSNWAPISAQIASNTYPGLVKSGGDVTIDNTGIITVNDDSHNHVISNIDGLQALLDTFEASGSADGAYAKAVSYTDTKIANLVNSAPATLDTLKELADAITSNQEVIDVLNSAITKKLPLAGGTMDKSATILFPTSGTNTLSVSEKGIFFTSVTSGHARGLNFLKSDGQSVMGTIGAHSQADNLSYYYIGPSWDTAKIKMYNNGNSKAEKFTVKEKVELDYNSTTDSLTLNFI